MSGPAPKPAHLRQRQNRKAGSATLMAVPSGRVPPLPNPDNRAWHPLTRTAWAHVWTSPMAGQWLQTDADALGRLALLWDAFYKRPSAEALKEIRLQSALFGLSPLDRSRLQWEVEKGSEAQEREKRRKDEKRRAQMKAGADPRTALMAVK